MSNSQKKKAAQAAAAAAAKEEAEGPQMPEVHDPNVKYLWSPSPAYIDSRLSLAQGRRVGKETACLGPSISEMSEICQHLRLRHVMEPYKQYPRMFAMFGRIRVEINHPDGSLCNPEIKTKLDLLKHMCQTIPKLKSRIRRMEEIEASKALAIQQSAATSSATGTGQSSSSSSNKKKNKRKA